MCHDFPSTGAMIWSFTTPKIPPYGWDEVDDVKFLQSGVTQLGRPFHRHDVFRNRDEGFVLH